MKRALELNKRLIHGAEPEPVRLYYQDTGRLAATGCRWEESRAWLETPVGILVAVPLAVAIAGLVGLLVTSSKLLSFFAVLGGLAAAAAIGAITNPLMLRSRNLLFHDDGSVTEEHRGKPYVWEKTRHADVLSIEAVEKMVVIYTQGGDSIRVAQDLKPWQAHKLAVQLTLALKALRESKANANAAEPTPPAAPRTQVLID